MTAGVLTWSFSGGRPARLCAGSVLSGSVTFANPGVELGRAAYIPSGTMRVDLAGVAGAPRRAAQLFQLSSAELPAPGQQVSRTFSFTIPAGSAAVPELRIVAEVYGGRTARFTDVYRWTGR